MSEQTLYWDGEVTRLDGTRVVTYLSRHTSEPGMLVDRATLYIPKGEPVPGKITITVS